MTSNERNILSAWKAAIKHPENIRLVATNPFQHEDLAIFCDLLRAELSITIQEKERKGALPGLTIRDRIIYHAVPSGPELEPFLKALTLDEHQAAPDQESIGHIDAPALLTLYIAPQCPYCPAAVNKIIPLTQAGKQVRIKIIDGTLFPDLAEKDGVQAAPTLIFNEFRWTNSIDVKEVIQAILHNDTVHMGPNALKDMIHNGEASRVAAMMITRDRIFPALFDLLTHEKWPVRLGAMVVMEEITQTAPKLAATMIQPVLKRFSGVNNQIQGDMVYLMGEAGNLDTVPVLEGLRKKTSDHELQTVIIEAIESIRKRHGLA